MLPNKATVLFCTAVLLLGCSRSPAPPPVASAHTPVASKTPAAVKQITEEQAFKLLTSKLKERKKDANLACLSFVIENDPTGGSGGDWEYGAREIHNEKCGGDPQTSPLIARYQVTAAGKVLLYDFPSGEYGPF